MKPICTKPDCSEPSFKRSSKTTFYCVKHYRFFHMRCSAKQAGKTVPSYSEMDLCLSHINNMKCPVCQNVMQWSENKRTGRKNVISLQHWDNGKIGFICFSCNSAHANSFLGDKFAELKSDEKACPKCGIIKKKTAFNKHRARRSGLDIMCRECRKKKDEDRRKANYDTKRQTHFRTQRIPA